MGLHYTFLFEGEKNNSRYLYIFPYDTFKFFTSFFKFLVVPVIFLELNSKQIFSAYVRLLHDFINHSFIAQTFIKHCACVYEGVCVCVLEGRR